MSDRASDVFHYAGLDYWGPMSAAKMERVIGYLPLERGARVLDIGCGKAELLLRLVERYGVEGIGVDRSRDALALARAAVDARVPDAPVHFIETDVAEEVTDAPEHVVSIDGAEDVETAVPDEVLQVPVGRIEAIDREAMVREVP